MSVVKNFTDSSRFKLKGIAVYGSDEWMADTKKKYRTVFDRAEADYIRCEFSFYNKAPENSTWKCTVTFRCFGLEPNGRKEICSLDNAVEVKGSDDVVYVRDGWGNPKPGIFWDEGEYVWEVLMDGNVIGEASFIINNVAQVRRAYNPYFVVNSMKFYGGDFDGWKAENRHYFSTFERQKTQYVWVEFTIKNKLRQAWDHELFFNFYDAARQMKGQVVRKGHTGVGTQDYSYTFDAGWGNMAPGSWKSELYYVDVIFMDTMIASAAFFIGEKDIPGEPANLFRVPG